MGKEVFGKVPTGGPDGGSDRKRPKSRSPLAGETLELAPLEDQIGWYLTHYRYGRTKPCFGNECGCQRAGEKWPTRWQGYLLALEMPQRRVVLAVLTKNCWDGCRALRPGGEALRGSKLTLVRRGGAQGIVEAGIVPDFYPKRTLPELPYTHQDQLMRVWFNGLDSYVDLAAALDLRPSQDPVEADDSSADGALGREDDV
jgi:hypothetical protein